MKILISGSHGLVGQALNRSLSTDGHTVLRLVRRPSSNESEIEWRQDAGVIDPARIEDLDAVVHLAGESLADGRWTEARKRRLWSSRVPATELLSRTIARLDPMTGAELQRVRVGPRPGALAAGGGAVWAALSDGGVARYDIAADRLQRIDVGGTPGDLVFAAGSVWVAVDES